MDPIELLKKKLATNAERRAALQRELGALDIEDHKIGNAVEVMSDLLGVEAAPDRGPGLFPIANDVPMPEGKVSVKKLVLNELGKAAPLTKMDVVSRLTSAGHKVNPTTVGSLLSKMVGSEVEKAGLAAYRLKDESPALTGLSGATMSEPDEL